MTLQRLRRLLCITIAITLLASVFLVWVGIFVPTNGFPVGTLPALELAGGIPQGESGSAMTTLAEFEKVWNKRIQQTLRETPSLPPKKPERPISKPVPKTPPPVKLPPEVRLLGTFIEDGAERAILHVPATGTTVVKVGDLLPALASARVESIDGESIVLRYHEQDAKLTLPSPRGLDLKEPYVK